jgi:uncharacterized membrane protein
MMAAVPGGARVTAIRTDPLFVLSVLVALIACSEWLARRPGFRHLGSALLVIVLGAVAANLGIIPAGSPPEAPIAVYEIIFASIAPIGLFWLLLQVNLRDLLAVGLPLTGLFLVGSLGTLAGAVAAMWLVRGPETVGPLSHAIAGMFTGTYTGGSVNFNAVALEYGVMRDGVLYGGSVVVDNIVTTIWIVATLAIPRTMAAVWARRAGGHGARAGAAPIVDLAAEIETLDPRKLALVIALGTGALWLSDTAARVLGEAGIGVPSILIISALALALAQVRAISRLPGARVLGMCAVYLFLTVIGAFCDVGAMGRLGTLGLVLLAFASFTVIVHGGLIFGTAWLFRMDLDGAAVASQANVGGSTSALALAKSLGREDLLVPGILLGSLGNAIGTFLGFLAARMSSL